MNPAVLDDPVIDAEHPLEFVLKVFDMCQLVELATKVATLANYPGFGEVVITVVNRHPRHIRQVMSEDFSPAAIRERLRERGEP